MPIVLTEGEKQLIAEGKLDPAKIEEHRRLNPVKSVDLNEVDRIKQEIRDTNALYQQSIQKNKELYDLLKENRKAKADHRNKLMELRKRKKDALGQPQ